ncbi:hypothetical protein OS493_007780 [Desmophyllum pertusum]|uniref:Uncharacterized protein n=1 Tax=Desmophyllum pertusum TaxID=174260 RepID=A0A9W9YRV2_9CNID|nr:hypothetical protein OS493_007780 [Desmophyllum pertusum]
MIFGVEEDTIEEIVIRAMNPKCSKNGNGFASLTEAACQLETLGYLRSAEKRNKTETSGCFFLKEVACEKLFKVGREVTALFPSVVSKKCVRDLQRQITGKDVKTQQCQAGIEIRGADIIFFVVVMKIEGAIYSNYF